MSQGHPLAGGLGLLTACSLHYWAGQGPLIHSNVCKVCRTQEAGGGGTSDTGRSALHVGIEAVCLSPAALSTCSWKHLQSAQSTSLHWQARGGILGPACSRGRPFTSRSQRGRPGHPCPLEGGDPGPHWVAGPKFGPQRSPKKGHGSLDADQHVVLAECWLVFIEHRRVPSTLPPCEVDGVARRTDGQTGRVFP